MIFEWLLLVLAWSVLNTLLQYTAGNTLWPLIGLSLAAGIGCYLLYPVAIEQSVPVLKKLPEDPLWLQRITVFILAELLLRWMMVNSALRAALGYPVKKWLRWFQYIPMPGLPAALFLFEVMLFYADTDTAFQTLATGYALGVALALVALGVLLRWLLPGREQRLELAQVLLIITAASTCMLSVNVQFDQLGHTADKLADYRPFGMLVLLVLLVGALGYVLSTIRIKRNGFFK
ncbi:MAG: hypothetical protein QM664_14710 [Flavihumibacter sp.]